MWSRLMMKDPEFCYLDLTFEEEIICIVSKKLLKSELMWISVNKYKDQRY